RCVRPDFGSWPIPVARDEGDGDSRHSGASALEDQHRIDSLAPAPAGVLFYRAAGRIAAVSSSLARTIPAPFSSGTSSAAATCSSAPAMARAAKSVAAVSITADTISGCAAA